MKFDFLQSTRFWALVLGAASTVLIDPEFASQPWNLLVGKFVGIVSAGFWATRTIDRTVDNISKN